MFNESTGDEMSETRTTMEKMGYKHIEKTGRFGTGGYTRRAAGQIITITDDSGTKAPETLTEPILVYFQDIGGGNRSEPCYWTSIQTFIGKF